MGRIGDYMEIIEKAPAKINLGLDVLYKRDDGYHELEMIMSSIDLADHLTFRTLEKDEIIIETDNSFLPLDERNHIYQAAMLLKSECSITKGVHVQMQKRIPVAAGMAGGSSDAAATLRGLNRLWNLKLSLEELAKVGEKVGSDVPYCIYGNTAYVRGKGEKIEFLPKVPQCWVVLVKPRLSVSTGTVFHNLKLEQLVHPDIQGIKEGIKQQNFKKMIASLGNSLEAITVQNYPIVGFLKEKMQQFGADVAVMSGSGPTVFALCEKRSRAQRVCNGLKGFCEEVYLIRTLNK